MGGRVIERERERERERKRDKNVRETIREKAIYRKIIKETE